MWRSLYRSLRKIYFRIDYLLNAILTILILKGNGVQYGKSFKSFGRPVLDVWRGGSMILEDNVSLNNGNNYNMIGRQQRCLFVVRSGAVLSIGNNTGISATAIVCASQISIGKFVKIGGNTVIYDTDFHSLDAVQRAHEDTDKANTQSIPVIIGDHVFIGAHSTILKGVTIGEHSIIGAGSVVTKSIPPYEIWGGNPAKFIKAAGTEANSNPVKKS